MTKRLTFDYGRRLLLASQFLVGLHCGLWRFGGFAWRGRIDVDPLAGFWVQAKFKAVGVENIEMAGLKFFAGFGFDHHI